MKYNFYHGSSLRTGLSVGLSLLLILTLTLFSCNKKDSAASFSLSGGSTDLSIESGELTENYSISTSGSWEVVPVEPTDWITVTPMKGNGSADITVTIKENKTPEVRKANFAFRVDGRFQSDLLSIEQEGIEGEGDGDEDVELYLEVEGITDNKLDISSDAYEETYFVRSNGPWAIEWDETIDWISVGPTEGLGDGSITISVDRNTNTESRSVDLNFILDEDGDQEEVTTIAVNQEEADEETTIILSQDFNWLSYGSPIFYETGGETRADSWTPEEQQNTGWTTTIATEAGFSVPYLYARQGFVKLGKTAAGADLISPKLSALDTDDGTAVTVQFKAVPYQTKGGGRDDNKLFVEVTGGGTADQDEFTIDNWPDYDADPTCELIWQEERSLYEFTITGATSETQIKFLGNDYDLSDNSPNKNRIFLDDIVVSLKQD